jgi:1,4-dihydroxy-6-naphthoate synthase
MARKKISIGFSPCPNDTFIFDALVNGRLDQDKYQFEPFLDDVEALNKMAREGKLDVTKISAGLYSSVAENYIILDAGSALGRGVGPLLVSKNPKIDLSHPDTRVAIPGLLTTANLLLTMFYPDISNKIEFLFSDIEDAIAAGKAEVGLLIHEGRFTYEKKGLHKISDLGAQWEARTLLPLPLGVIVASRKLSEPDRTGISKLIRKSLEHAQKDPTASQQYVHQYAQEMDENVIMQHIQLYVNEFTLSLGDEGRNAIKFLLKKGSAHGLIPEVSLPIFNSNKS